MKHLLLIFTALLLLSCKAQKSVIKEQSETKTEIQNDISETFSSAAAIEEKNNTEVTKTENSVSNTKVTHTIFSPPDESGKQFIQEQIIYENNTSTDVGTLERRNEETHAQVEENYSKDDQSVSAEASTNKKSENITPKKPTPLWAVILVIILSLGLLFIVYLILKRFKIVK